VPSFRSATAGSDSATEAQSALAQRRAILGPCLAAMGFTELGGPPPDLPEQLLYDGLAVALEPWERNVLLGRAVGDSEVILAHLAEGIAFRAKCQSSLLRLEHAPPPPERIDAVLEELIEDAASGLALQQEVQRDIDRLVGKGELSAAKRLTGFRRKIDQGLAGLEQHIGAEGNEQAQARSTEMLTPRNWEPAPRKRVLPRIEELDLPPLPAAEPAVSPAAPEPTAEELFAQGLLEQARHEEEASVGREPRRRRGRLIVLLVASLVVYGVFRMSRTPDELPPRLEMDRFAQIDGVLQVRPRPPSLFVKLDTKSWNDLTPIGRLELLDQLGRVAGDEGYFGVHVKTEDGQTVGQWMRKTGAKLTAGPPQR